MVLHKSKVRTAIIRRLFHAYRVLNGEGAALNHRLFGYKIRLSLNEQIQTEIALGTYEPEETRWVMSFLRPGMVVVDVGANVGYYTLLFASRVGPKGRVIAFEPSPYCQSRLAETVRRNSISQITLEPVALADQAGEMELVVEHKELHSPSFLAAEGDLRYHVPVTTLDSYLATVGISHVDLLKIDVEGFEPNVIRGGVNHLRTGAIGAILCELNEIWLARNHSSGEQLDELVGSFGFTAVKTARYAYHRNVLYSKTDSLDLSHPSTRPAMAGGDGS